MSSVVPVKEMQPYESITVTKAAWTRYYFGVLVAAKHKTDKFDMTTSYNIRTHLESRSRSPHCPGSSVIFLLPLTKKASRQNVF